MLKNFLTIIIDSTDIRGIQETLVSLNKQDKSKGLKVIVSSSSNSLFFRDIQGHKYDNIKLYVYKNYSIDALIRKVNTQYVMVMTPKEFVETNFLVNLFIMIHKNKYTKLIVKEKFSFFDYIFNWFKKTKTYMYIRNIRKENVNEFILKK